MSEWKPIETVERHSGPVLLRFRSDRELPPRAHGFADRVFVGIWRGTFGEWCFYAPVGHGGIPDSWLLEWHPIP